MTLSPLAAIAAPFAFLLAPAVAAQASAEAPISGEPSGTPIASLDELPIEQAAAPRCGIAFALVSRWQNTGDARGSDYINMESEGGREFFVQTMVKLMDDTGMDREALTTLTMNEVQKLENDQGAERVQAMMPACLLMKRSAGL